MDERPAPVVTITDPGRPGRPVDVVVGGRERDPWRPTRQHVKATALLTALAIAALLPQQVVAARAAEDRAAAAAADAVRLSVSPGDRQQSGGVPVVVHNDGPQALRLLELRVDGPGYPSQRVDRDVARSEGAAVTVLDTRSCGEDLLEAGQSGLVRLRARTRAGREVSRAVVLAPDTWGALVGAAQLRCGDLAPQQALRAVVTGVTPGPIVGLHLELENRGHVPLWLAYAGLPVPGLSPVPTQRLPLLLAAAPGRVVPLDLRVSLQECTPEASAFGDQPVLNLAVTPLLAGGRAGTQVDVHVLSRAAEAALRDLVATRCGADQTAG